MIAAKPEGALASTGRISYHIPQSRCVLPQRYSPAVPRAVKPKARRARNLTASPVAQAVAAPQDGVAEKRTSLAGGTLEMFDMPNGRTLRVWLPPGYSPTSAARSPYPVAYLNDGQNLFDPTLTLSGSCWEAAETAAALISSRKLSPFIIVGIDHAGAQRSFEYTPVVPGTGPGGVRKDAAKWPGGGVNAYLAWVVQDVIPTITERYNTSIRPADRLFGGSSFGGICALCMAMRYPHMFGSILVESPSLWIDNEKWLEKQVEQYRDDWPQYTFVGMGSAEYTGLHPDDPQREFDQRLAGYVARVVTVVKKQGHDKKVMGVVQQGAGHAESAWASRLPEALTFLCKHWRHQG